MAEHVEVVRFDKVANVEQRCGRGEKSVLTSLYDSSSIRPDAHLSFIIHIKPAQY